MDDLSALKASAGERHARDEANNPQLGTNKVPAGSAAQKTDSALGHYTAALAAEQSLDTSEPQKLSKATAGDSIPLDAEPALASKIADQAASAENPAAAEHFAQASTNLQAAYEQDKAWLNKHPEHAGNSRT